MEPFPRVAIPQEILEWARAHIDEEQIAADLLDVEKTGGMELREFIAELKTIAGCDE